MSGSVKSKKKRKPQHAPLAEQIEDVKSQGVFRAPGSRASKTKRRRKDAAPEAAVVPDKLSERILKQAAQQQQEQEKEEKQEQAAEDGEEEEEVMGAGQFRISEDFAEDDSEEEEEEDVGEVETQDIELSAEDEASLAMFLPQSSKASRTLADIIMDQLAAQGKPRGEAAPKLDPRVVQVYTQVGKYLSHFTSGKVPKAFKIIPALKNWEEVLQITQPEQWTVQAVSRATKLFASNLNPKMAQRFFHFVLLPRVRTDIAANKVLNYHLYMSLKKAIYKPAAFFKGVVLPLAEEGCTPRESIIMGCTPRESITMVLNSACYVMLCYEGCTPRESIIMVLHSASYVMLCYEGCTPRESIIMCSVLARTAVPVLHSAAALLKLTELEYSGPTMLFMKTLLSKKYSLPFRLLSALSDFFCRFATDERKMPVIWHSTLLLFLERYKKDLKPEHKAQFKELFAAQFHHAITPLARREIFALAPSQQGDQGRRSRANSSALTSRRQSHSTLEAMAYGDESP
eukprot:g4966.t1